MFICKTVRFENVLLDAENVQRYLYTVLIILINVECSLY